MQPPADPPSVPPDLYDERYFLNTCGGAELFRAFGSKILKPNLADVLLRAGIRPGMRVLDLGCGRGEALCRLKEMGALPFGGDFSQAALEIARKVAPGIPLERCDVKKLPFQDAQFDRVLLRGVFEHLHPWEQERCVREMLRVSKPGGRIVLDTCTNRLYYKTLTYELRLALVEALRAAGLSLRLPSPPRTDEDRRLHVSEQSCYSLRRFFRPLPVRARIHPRPNPKLRLRELYGDSALSPDFPIRPMPAPMRLLYSFLLFRPPLSYFLARSFVCVIEL